MEPVPPGGLPPALPNEGAFAASGTSVTVLGKRLAWIGTGAAERARVLRSATRGARGRSADTPIRAGRNAGSSPWRSATRSHGVIVGGDHTKEREAVDNAAITSDGGVDVGSSGRRGLSGFRSVVSTCPAPSAHIALGPRAATSSTDDGQTWAALDGSGADTLSSALENDDGVGGSRSRRHAGEAEVAGGIDGNGVLPSRPRGDPSSAGAARRPAILAFVLTLSHSSPDQLRLRAQAQVPHDEITPVALQPLAQQVRRVESVLASLGQPLSADAHQALNGAIGERDERRAVRLIDDALAPLVLLDVTINPESRVSVVQGPRRRRWSRAARDCSWCACGTRPASPRRCVSRARTVVACTPGRGKTITNRRRRSRRATWQTAGPS